MFDYMADAGDSLIAIRCAPLCTVLHIRHARLARAVCTAVERLIGFDAMTDYLASAVVANRGELLNRTLEAIERVSNASSNNFK